MFEKYKNEGGKVEKKTGEINRREYLKQMGVAGSGIALGGAGLGSFGTGQVRAAETVIENFNRTSPLDDYNGETGGADYQIVQDTMEEGTTDSTNTLKATGAYGDLGSTTVSTPRGNEYRARIKVGDSTAGPSLLTCVQDTTSAINGCYWAYVNQKYGSLDLSLRQSGNHTDLASASLPTLTQGTIYELAVELGSDTVRAILYESDGTTVIADTGSVSDSTFSGGQLGFYTGGGGYPAYYDYVTEEALGSGSGTTGDIGKYKTVENFKKPTGLSPYSFDRGESGAEIVETSEYSGPNALGGVYNGRRGLKISGQNTEMISTSGLENYPSAGDSFACYFMPTGGADNFNISWGVQGHGDRYYIKVKPESERMYLFKYQNGQGETLNSAHLSPMSQDTWYWLEVTWGTDGTQTVEIYDLEDNTLGTVTGTDSTWTSGGIGFDGYFANTSGTGVYIDHFTVGEMEYHSGGWGIVHRGDKARDDSNSNSVDTIQDFNFFFDYDGREQLGSDKYVHYFTVGSLGNTYRVDEGVTNPSKDQIGYADLLEQSEVTIDLNNLANTNNQYLYWNDQKSYAAKLGSADWKQWKENNWSDWATSQQVKDKAVNSQKLNTEEENQGLFDTFIAALGFVPILGDVIGAIELIDTLDKDASACEYYENPQPNKVYVRWDLCNKVPMLLHIVPFRIEVPMDESVDATIKQVFSTPSTTDITYHADNAMEWGIHIPAGGHAKYETQNLHSTQ